MREVTILGMGPSYIECPYDTEIWICMSQLFYAKHLDAVFCFHDWAEYEKDWLEKLMKKYEAGCRIVASTRHPEIDVTLFPIEEILNEFRVKYFRDTIALMIAYAIYCRYERIKIYGCDCMAHSVYIDEKAPTEFWCGVARGRGIELKLAPSTPLCRIEGEAFIKPKPIPAKRWQNEGSMMQARKFLGGNNVRILQSL